MLFNYSSLGFELLKQRLKWIKQYVLVLTKHIETLQIISLWNEAGQPHFIIIITNDDWSVKIIETTKPSTKALIFLTLLVLATTIHKILEEENIT